jgi:hypothetical protein
MVLPTDLSDATGSSSVIGKLRSASTLSITVPTNPVAPTTATFILILDLKSEYYILRKNDPKYTLMANQKPL